MDLLSRPLSGGNMLQSFGRGGLVTDFGGAMSTRPLVRFALVVSFPALRAGCSMFAPSKIPEEPVIAPAALDQTALTDMDGQRDDDAVKQLQKHEEQDPYSEYNEKAKLMESYAN